MERLTDPAQGYCEMYCKKYGSCFGDPGDCIFEKERAMYDALRSIEGIVPFERILPLLASEKDGRCVVLPTVKGADIGNPLEPLKVYSALKSEVLKYEYRAEREPQKINVLDYTIIMALTRAEAEKALEAENAEHKTH